MRNQVLEHITVIQVIFSASAIKQLPGNLVMGEIAYSNKNACYRCCGPDLTIF
jgi:hypothetical protein